MFASFIWSSSGWKPFHQRVRCGCTTRSELSLYEWRYEPDTYIIWSGNASRFATTFGKARGVCRCIFLFNDTVSNADHTESKSMTMNLQDFVTLKIVIALDRYKTKPTRMILLQGVSSDFFNSWPWKWALLYTYYAHWSKEQNVNIQERR